MPEERVLISGAGIAGSILAYWLGRNAYKVVVVERSRANQKLGQGIEIEEPALQVVKRMRVMDRLNAIRTGEAGFSLFNSRGGACGTLEADKFISPTGALEMMRGDMAEVFYKTADESPNVEYRFQTTVKKFSQTADKITVDLEDRANQTTTTEEFDFMIGADGARSRTRQSLFGPDEETKCLNPIGIVTAYFSIPSAPHDYPYSRLCNYPGRRIIWTRPIREKCSETSAYIIQAKPASAALREANLSGDRAAQKKCYAEMFEGLGWEAPRVIAGMMEAENFYSDELVQVKLPRWHEGRVALVGDAAWAPTPVTGEGNQLAIIGAWVLAQEMVRDRTTAAFANYDARLRKYVDECQQIPLNGKAPLLLNPETWWGVAVLQNMFWVASKVVAVAGWLGLGKYLPRDNGRKFDLQMKEDETSM